MNINLSLREKILLVVAACVMVPLVLFNLAISPINSVIETSNRQITDAMDKSIEADRLFGEITYYKSTDLRAPTQTDVFLRNLISEMNVAQDAQIRNITSPDPDKKFQLTLSNFTNAQLVELIYKLENNIPVIKIDKLSVANDFRNKDRLKVEINLRSE